MYLFGLKLYLSCAVAPPLPPLFAVTCAHLERLRTVATRRANATIVSLAHYFGSYPAKGLNLSHGVYRRSATNSGGQPLPGNGDVSLMNYVFHPRAAHSGRPNMSNRSIHVAAPTPIQVIFTVSRFVGIPSQRRRGVVISSFGMASERLSSRGILMGCEEFTGALKQRRATHEIAQRKANGDK